MTAGSSAAPVAVVSAMHEELRALLPLLMDDYDVHIVTYKDKGVFFDELAELGVKIP